MENMPKVKVGVIGTGALGRYHAKLYAQSPNAEVVGLYDAHPEAAQRVAAEFNLKAFSSWEKLAEQCDALSVAVPATLHGETTLPLLEMGKHVLVEKPIASAKEEAEKMVVLAAQKELVFGVGHVERFNACMDYLDKNLTRPRFIEIQRLAPYPPPRPGTFRRGTEVSVVLDLMIHDIDLLLHMADSEVERVDAAGMTLLSGTEDFVNARIAFKNGLAASLTASRVTQTPRRCIRVFQQENCFTMDFGNHTGTVQTCSGDAISCENVTLDDQNALALELEDFVSAVRLTKAEGILHETRVPGTQGLKALELALAIEEASRRCNRQYGF